MKDEELSKGERRKEGKKRVKKAPNKLDKTSIRGWLTNGRSQSSLIVCPVRRQCPRFQAPGYTE
jgi:hypothetical protein